MLFEDNLEGRLAEAATIFKENYNGCTRAAIISSLIKLNSETHELCDLVRESLLQNGDKLVLSTTKCMVCKINKEITHWLMAEAGAVAKDLFYNYSPLLDNVRNENGKTIEACITGGSDTEGKELSMKSVGTIGEFMLNIKRYILELGCNDAQLRNAIIGAVCKDILLPIQVTPKDGICYFNNLEDELMKKDSYLSKLLNIDVEKLKQYKENSELRDNIRTMEIEGGSAQALTSDVLYGFIEKTMPGTLDVTPTIVCIVFTGVLNLSDFINNGKGAKLVFHKGSMCYLVDFVLGDVLSSGVLTNDVVVSLYRNGSQLSIVLNTCNFDETHRTVAEMLQEEVNCTEVTCEYSK